MECVENCIPQSLFLSSDKAILSCGIHMYPNIHGYLHAEYLLAVQSIPQVQLLWQCDLPNVPKGSLFSTIPQFLWDSFHINALSLSQRLINPGWRITLCDQYLRAHTVADKHRYSGLCFLRWMKLFQIHFALFHYLDITTEEEGWVGW